MSLRVAFNVYSSAFQSPGGGEVQLLKTKEFLEKEGLEVRLFNPWTDKLKDFDILHTFGSVKDSLGLMEAAHALGVKNVLSTICWYSWKSAWGTYGSAKSRALAVLRHAAKEFFPFVPSMRKRMMQISDFLLPNSESEASQLSRFFGIPKDKIRVVPNGVDPYFAAASPRDFVEKFNLQNFVLSVGRIEPRKNQLNVVKALSGLEIPVVFIGEPVHHYQDYYAACKKAAGPNIHFLGGLPHNSQLMASAYAACNTFLLGTWLETPGLAALEAALTGAKIVITQEGATKEYFQDLVSYVNPANLSDIRKKVQETYQAPKNPNLREHVLSHYLWTHTAKKTLAAYRELIHPQGI